MNLTELWQELELEASASGDGSWIVRRLHPHAFPDVRIGVGTPQQTRALLLRVSRTAIPVETAFPVSRGFLCHEAQLNDCPQTHATICVSLTDPAFADIFTPLVDDVLQHLHATSSDAQVVSELANRLKLWQWFMERAGAGGLSSEAQRGLYGELIFLREILIPEVGPVAAIQAWTGPTGAAQDFQWRRLACEAKATTSKQHLKIRISNELQLDSSTVDALWIYHLSLDARPGSGETLVDAVEAVRRAVSSEVAAAERFSNLLLEAGYHPTHAGSYTDPGYTIRSESFFAVQDGFPRLVGTSLPDGVGDVSYSIAISECMPFRVDAIDVRQTMRTKEYEP